MATSNFLIFDESLTDMDTDVEYLAESQRMNGVTPGLASPKMHNKLYRQCSVMAYAIASVLAARGYNADDSDPATLIDAIQRSFAHTVNGNAPDGSGAVTAIRPLDAWPVGSVFITVNSTSPVTLLGGGTWVKIEGKYLLAADPGDVVDGSTTVGAMTKNVPLVSHTHTFTTASNGAHTHSVSGTTGAAGGHSHTRGSMNITGTFNAVWEKNIPQVYTGAFTQVDGERSNEADGQGSGAKLWDFDASRSWTGSTSAEANHSHSFSATSESNGAHTHTGTTASSGTSASFDVRPLSVVVYMWRRTA